ncbi:MAG: COX15/CtaA family protein [Gammaproteobacteria bacterium]|nr:COX15/CtaA family protein [Gammaproteobacteria bacterium]
MKLLRSLASVAIVLAMLVIVLGAYTRLTDAGLGCPDWPGCYGFLKVPQHEVHVAVAEARFPERPLEAHKAWNEMVHRYFAGSLGLLIAAIFFISWRQQRKIKLLPTVLVCLVVFQAALGMWTVTLNLFPLVVMGHLLGGFSLLTLLMIYRWQLTSPQHKPSSTLPAQNGLARLGWLVVVILLGQIALGGWTSANYAAMACVELPVCQAGWSEQLRFGEAFDLHLGHDNYEYGVMSQQARQTIHIAHRFGALLTLLAVGGFIIRLLQSSAQTGMSRLPVVAGALLLLQFCLGIINVWWQLPLVNAVAHNFVAANLLMVLTLICVQLQQHVQFARRRL